MLIYIKYDIRNKPLKIGYEQYFKVKVIRKIDKNNLIVKLFLFDELIKQYKKSTVRLKKFIDSDPNVIPATEESWFIDGL